MYIGFYIKSLYYSNKLVNIVNLNFHILITYNHVKTHVCCVWRFFKIKTIIIIIIIIKVSRHVHAQAQLISIVK